MLDYEKDKYNKPLSWSEVDKKLVVIDNFSDVVYLAKIAAFLKDQGSKESPKPSSALCVSESDFCNNNKEKLENLSDLQFRKIVTALKIICSIFNYSQKFLANSGKKRGMQSCQRLSISFYPSFHRFSSNSSHVSLTNYTPYFSLHD